MNKKMYFMLGMIFIMTIIFTITIITTAQESVTYEIKNLSDEGATTVLTSTGNTWRLETEDSYNLCRAGISGLTNLNCSQPTYKEFLDYWVEKNEQNMINSKTTTTTEQTLLQRIESLEAENKMLKTELCKRDNTYSWCKEMGL